RVRRPRATRPQPSPPDSCPNRVVSCLAPWLDASHRRCHDDCAMHGLTTALDGCRQPRYLQIATGSQTGGFASPSRDGFALVLPGFIDGWISRSIGELLSAVPTRRARAYSAARTDRPCRVAPKLRAAPSPLCLSCRKCLFFRLDLRVARPHADSALAHSLRRPGAPCDARITRRSGNPVIWAK